MSSSCPASSCRASPTRTPTPFTARYEGTSLSYTYKGSISGDTMTGTVDLGEYGPATFTATRKA